MDENNNKNLILATVLSFLVLIGWFILFPPQEQQAPLEAPTSELAVPAVPEVVPGAVPGFGADVTTAQALAATPRVGIDTPELEGTISLLGGRIDDLSLKDYKQTIEPNSPIVRLFEPAGEAQPYYALFGWSPAGSLNNDDVPHARTPWTYAGGETKLSPTQPVVLQWDNGKGLRFTRTITVDEKFMFTVTDGVENTTAGDVNLAHYAQLARHGEPVDLANIFVVHEGTVGRIDGKLVETDYSEIADFSQDAREGGPARVVNGSTDGWIGFTDHYWMSILVPEQGKPFTEVTKYSPTSNIYQTEVRAPYATVAAGQKIEHTTRLFAGAKEWETIRNYQNEVAPYGGAELPKIAGFLDSIDWGWFFFLTKPIFWMLHWINAFIGNMGLAIIGLTFVLKLIVLPLAYKSYVSMARMKELQPEMEALKERAGDDRQKLQKEMMQLYREKKVNPAAGCLPILIQIPIFFSLYKVIFVTLELRHAPFFGWLKDLSAPDPSSLFNLFGLLPWDAPVNGSMLHLVFIGVLPILLGISMWLQQKLNPAPADPVQGQIFAWMPWIFMFMLGGFASGLVVYWITNNVITFGQQYIIMRSHGHKPDLFGNIRSSFKKKTAADKGGKTKK